jgi:hypothetical protein
MSGNSTLLTVFFALFTLIFILIVLASMIWRVVVIVRLVGRTRQATGLRRTGHRVTAQAAKISREFVYAPRGFGGFRFVWYVAADWTDPQTGIPYRFRSGPLYRRQAKLYAVGELIRVLVDPADPNRYYVEPAH